MRSCSRRREAVAIPAACSGTHSARGARNKDLHGDALRGRRRDNVFVRLLGTMMRNLEAVPNKPLVPTRTGEAPVLAAQRRRLDYKEIRIQNMITRNAKISDIDGILTLQSRYLYANLSERERLNGFVTTPFTDKQFETLLGEDGVYVAINDDEVAGYALAGSWRFFSQWLIFPYMVARLPALNLGGRAITSENSFQYGPVCVDEKYRGSGLFPRLFEQMRLGFSNRYPIGVTFINRLNQRSYVAHTRKLEMQVIDHFEFGGRPYYGLAFDTKVSVLSASNTSLNADAQNQPAG